MARKGDLSADYSQEPLGSSRVWGMERQIDETAGRVNGTYGEASWTPIRYVNRAHSRTALVGLYRSARAALVTPLRDGMNLWPRNMWRRRIGKTRNLILSRFAGAAVECEAALLVNPYDPESVGYALAQALSMPLEERRARHDASFRVLAANDVDSWGERFLIALTRPVNLPNWLGQSDLIGDPVQRPVLRRIGPAVQPLAPGSADRTHRVARHGRRLTSPICSNLSFRHTQLQSSGMR